MALSEVAFNLLLVLFFTFLNGFFVAAEFAIVKIRPTRLQELAQEGRPGAKVAQHVTEHLGAYLSACQLGITLASLALGALGEPAVASLIAPGLHASGLSEAAIHGIAFAIAFSVITVLHIVLGELAPKSLAIATEARSLGGWIYATLGCAPQSGDTVAVDGYVLEVSEVEHLRIVRVLARPATS